MALRLATLTGPGVGERNGVELGAGAKEGVGIVLDAGDVRVIGAIKDGVVLGVVAHEGTGEDLQEANNAVHIRITM